MNWSGRSIRLVVFLAILFSPFASDAAIELTINNQGVDSIELAVGEGCLIEVVSNDFDSYAAYLEYYETYGDFSHSSTEPEAGDFAQVTDLGEAFEVVAFGVIQYPSPGVHFVFQYEAGESPGTEVLTLYDGEYTNVLDVVEIYVGGGSGPNDPPPDTEPPSPDPMTWSSAPAAVSAGEIVMTATTATDDNDVEYYFECVSGGGDNSDWQSETYYSDSDLLPDTEYSYRVKARDLSENVNETQWSVTQSARTLSNIVYVDDNAPDDPGPGDPYYSDPNENGSLDHPFDSIQEAVDTAWIGHTVIVLDGTYTEHGNREIDFYGKAITVRSMNGPDNCTIDLLDPNLGGYRGFHFNSSEGSDSVVDGFLIKNGYASPGGGIFCDYASPTIRNCRFSNNEAPSHSGGGIYCLYSDATITNCTFTGNLAHYGGAIRCFYGSPEISNCTISGNSAENEGGGICCYFAGPVITNCVINSNTSYRGGGVHSYSSGTMVENCTIYDNNGVYGGAIYSGHDSNTVVKNCILWADVATYGPEIAIRTAENTSDATVSYSDVQGGSSVVYYEEGCILNWRTGNINTDPNFASAQDYHLLSGSPCVDAGDPTGDYSGQTDIDGDPRLMGSFVDMGADEHSIHVPRDYNTVDEAIEAANDGDTIVIEPGTFAGSDDANGFDLAGRSITIRGSDPNDPNVVAETIIDCNHIRRGFQFRSGETSEVVIEGLTIINGLASQGGAISCIDSSPTIRNCVITNSAAGAGTTGGAMHCEGTSSPVVSNCTFTNNAAQQGGAVSCRENSNVELVNCNITDNFALGLGGGVYCEDTASVIMRGCSITGNTTRGYGGGVYCTGGVLEGCTIVGNSAYLGSGVYFANKSDVTCSDCNIDDVAGRISGSSSIDLGETGSITVVDAFAIGGYATVRGSGSLVVDFKGQLILDSNAVVNLEDPNDPNGNGTMRCNGLLRVKDNVEISDANMLITRARFENDANISHNVIRINSRAPYGHFVVRGNVKITYNDMYVNGDRYMDLDPSIFAGEFVHNRIYVTITEGVGQDYGGLFELRGVDGLVSHSCDVNEYECPVVPGSIPDCNRFSWTIERVELVEGAKLNCTNRFSFQPPFAPGDDNDVLYVRELVLNEGSIFNTAFNRIYCENLYQAPTADIRDVPLLGFSLINITFDDPIEYLVRVTHNNFKHPQDPNYNRTHVERLVGRPVDPNGIMQMQNKLDSDPNSLTCGQIVNAKAKGFFAKASEDRIQVTFEYMFIDDPCDEAEIVVYLSDDPELGVNLLEVARIGAPAPNRPGSASSGEFSAFYGLFPSGGLEFNRGTYVQLELLGTDSRCWINNWDPSVNCAAICGDYYVDMFNVVNVYDYLVLLAEMGLSSPSAVGRGCLDLITDGCINADDLRAWGIDEVLNRCPEGAASVAFDYGPWSSQHEVGLSSVPTDPLHILGKPAGGVGTYVPDSYLYNVNTSGTAVSGPTSPACPSPSCDENSGRFVADGDGNLYQSKLLPPKGGSFAGRL